VSQLTTEDRLAITELLANYCHLLDDGRWDEFRTLFASDCRLDFGPLGSYEGPDGLKRFTDWLASTGTFMRHYSTNVVLHVDAEKVRSVSYVLAVTGQPGHATTMTGRYHDELVKQGGRWLLRSRRATLDVQKS